MSSIAERIAEAQALTRFFQKTIGEALHLGAEALRFSMGRDDIRVQMLRGGDELKALTLTPTWFDPLVNWLGQRSHSGLGELLPFGPDQTQGTPGIVGSGEELFLFRCGKAGRNGNERTFRISSLMRIPRADLVAALAPSATCRESLAALLEPGPGLLIVAAPRQEQIALAASTALALTGAISLGEVRGEDARGFVEGGVTTAYAAAGVVASDALSGLLSLREQGYNLDRLVLRGVLCLGFVRHTCSSCGRQTIVDRQSLETLPEPLQRVGTLERYRVGRGCSDCGQRGYKGLLPLESVLAEQQGAVTNLLRQGARDYQLLGTLRPQGLVALLEDGVTKVLAGQSTFEALYEVVRSMPDVYIRYLRENAAAPVEPPPPISGDFFQPVREMVAPAVRGRETFYPQRAASEPAAADNSPLFSVGAAGRPRPKPLVLVVEDDPDQRNILDIVLKSAGYQIAMAGNGKEAFAALERDLPDLIMTDVMMPEMDGTRFVKELRADSRYKTLPVMVLTVVADSDKEYTMLDLGADDYCEKTVQRKILLKRIEKLLKRRG